jgi:hypothetical protein
MKGTSDRILSYDDIISMFENINVIDFDIEKLENSMNDYELIRNNLDANFVNEINSFLQYRKLGRAIQLFIKNEKKKSFKYDIVLKLRTDIHHNKFEHPINSNTIVVSSGNVFPNDVLLATTRDKFLEIYNFIKSEFYNQSYKDSHLKAPHNLILCACRNCGLDIYQTDLMKYVVRKTGKQYYNTK